MLVMTLILTLSAAAIAIGVVYNNARIALSMRSRDLASLRVLGFTRVEISGILLGELAAQVVLGIPLGFVLGHWWARGARRQHRSRGDPVPAPHRQPRPTPRPP